jgi:hypothetical protein
MGWMMVIAACRLLICPSGLSRRNRTLQLLPRLLLLLLQCLRAIVFDQ